MNSRFDKVMTDFGNKGGKNLIEINNDNFCLTHPLWPFHKEVFQRTSYIKIKKITNAVFQLHLLNTTKMFYGVLSFQLMYNGLRVHVTLTCFKQGPIVQLTLTHDNKT